LVVAKVRFVVVAETEVQVDAAAKAPGVLRERGEDVRLEVESTRGPYLERERPGLRVVLVEWRVGVEHPAAALVEVAAEAGVGVAEFTANFHVVAVAAKEERIGQRILVLREPLRIPEVLSPCK